MKRAFLLLLISGLAFGQRLETGLWLGGPTFELGPTLKLELKDEATRYDLYFRGNLPRIDEFQLGLGLTHAWGLLPAGRAELGGRVFAGLDTQYWVEGRGRFTLGQVATGFRLGFTENRTPSHFWPLEQESLGPYGELFLDYRLTRRMVVLARAAHLNGQGRAELGARFYEERNRYLIGLGAYQRPTRAYAWLAWRGPVEDGVAELELRLGGYNAFRLGYATRAYRLSAEARYPVRLDLAAEWSGWRMAAAFRQDAYTFWLVRRIELE